MRPGHRGRSSSRRTPLSYGHSRYGTPSRLRAVPAPPAPSALEQLASRLVGRAGESVEERLVNEIAQLPAGRLKGYFVSKLEAEGVAVPDLEAEQRTLLCAVLGRFLREDRRDVIVLFAFEVHDALDADYEAAPVDSALAELVEANLLSETRQPSGTLYSLPLALNDPDAATAALDDHLAAVRRQREQVARAQLRSSALNAVGVAGMALAAGAAWLSRRR